MSQENKLKHLEFVQNIITRMNTNSFQIKGMSVTISTALLAFAVGNTSSLYALSAYLSLFIFWGLDAYYLGQEKSYRKLYDRIRIIEDAEVDFDLRLTDCDVDESSSWNNTLLNKTIIWIYATQAVIIFTLAWII